METEVVSAAQSIDFSLLALFWRATIVVKIVMITQIERKKFELAITVS